MLSSSTLLVIHISFFYKKKLLGVQFSKNAKQTIHYTQSEPRSESQAGLYRNWSELPTIETSLKHSEVITRCWRSAKLKFDPGNYSSIPAEHLSDLKQSGPSGELLPLTLHSSDIPYIFVVPELKGECPSWFIENMESTKYVQEIAKGVKDPNKVILVEGGKPKCAEWCYENGVTHVALAENEIERYWQILMDSYPANFNTPGITEHRNNLWLQSIVRYFMLNHFVQSSGLQHLIYLDWDTTVYIPSSEAWNIMQKVNIRIASCIYPPFGTANNIYTMFTREGLVSFVDFIFTTLLTQISPKCIAAVGKFGSLLSNDMEFVLQYFRYSSRNLIQPPEATSKNERKKRSKQSTISSNKTISIWTGRRHVKIYKSSWLNYAANFSSAIFSESAKLGCTDDNVTCGRDSRWYFTTGNDKKDNVWGQLYPPWKFRPPKYKLFNLCEPFGNGNVVSELLFESMQKVGGDGFRFGRNMLKHLLWDYASDGSKAIEWVEGRPYLSRLKPSDPSAPMWGYFNDVEAMRMHHPPRNFFRVWAVHFAMGTKKLLPHYSAKNRGWN